MGGVGKIVHTVHDHADFGIGLVAGALGRAIYNLKGTAAEGMAIFLITLQVDVTQAFQNTAAHTFSIKNAQGVVFKPAYPTVGRKSECSGGFLIHLLKAGENTVKIHIQCTVHFVKPSKFSHV